MSAIQKKGRRQIEIHILDGISWMHVSKSNGETQQLTLWMGFCGTMSEIQIPEGIQQLTSWMGFCGTMSATQIEPRRHTATHRLDGISWRHVSNSNGAQAAHSNSHTGWDFMEAYQQLKWSPGGTQQLTAWMGFHGGMSATQMEPRRHTATHSLDEIS